MDKRKVGSLYEEKALLYLQENGFTILERNFRTKVGEIDIIAIKNNILRLNIGIMTTLGTPYMLFRKANSQKYIRRRSYI